MTTPYTVTPVGTLGPVEARAQVVQGPALRDSLSRADLSRQLGQALIDNHRLIEENDVLRAAVVKLAYIDEKWEAEVAVRIRCQRKLHVAAQVLHAIERAYPHTCDMIDRAREDIWP